MIFVPFKYFLSYFLVLFLLGLASQEIKADLNNDGMYGSF